MIPGLTSRLQPTLEVTVTRLAMAAPPAEPRPTCPAPLVSVTRPRVLPVHFYRYLYATVGENWLWSDRRTLSDEAISSLLDDVRREVYVFWREGVPHGFSEIMRRGALTEIVLFGLMPEAVGKRTGAYLLRHMLEVAWSGGTSRVEIETCTLDHPKAIRLYQQAGFVPFERRVARKADPRLTGVLPREAAPHVPLAGSARRRRWTG